MTPPPASKGGGSLPAALSPARTAQRRERLRAMLVERKLDAVILFERTNTLYFTGFSGSNSATIITADQGDFFLTDFRYIEKATATLTGLEVVLMSQFKDKTLKQLLRKRLHLRRLGFEGRISFDTYGALSDTAGSSIKLKESGAALTALRAVKDEDELALIARNQKLNEQMQALAISGLQIGETETSIRNRMRHWLLDGLCEEAFDGIVAAAENSSLPHAVPGATKVRAGEYLLLDTGVKEDFYHSDLTRTYAVGKPSPRHREIYKIVLDAQEAALALIKPGARCVDIDAAARKVITDAKYGDYFGHGTGHGVGLEIHEGPRLSTGAGDAILSPGMVITVEPGIYLPGFGGVRIEDLVVVTKTGYKNLTQVSKTFKTITPR